MTTPRRPSTSAATGTRSSRRSRPSSSARPNGPTILPRPHATSSPRGASPATSPPTPPAGRSDRGPRPGRRPRLAHELAALKAVRQRTKTRPIVQRTRIGPELRETRKTPGISRPEQLLAVTEPRPGQPAASTHAPNPPSTTLGKIDPIPPACRASANPRPMRARHDRPRAQSHGPVDRETPPDVDTARGSGHARARRGLVTHAGSAPTHPGPRQPGTIAIASRCRTRAGSTTPRCAARPAAPG